MPETRPTLFSRRLRLEPLNRHHADSLFELFQDASLHIYTERGCPDDLTEFRRGCEFLESDESPDKKSAWLNWVSFDQTTNKIVGKIELSIVLDTGICNLAYYSFSGSGGQGFASEACRVVVDNAFLIYNLQKILLVIDPRNEPSLRVADAIGTTYVRTRPPEGNEGPEQKVFEFTAEELVKLRARNTE